MGNKIKPGEKMTLEYFQIKGYTNILHEQNPNHPPDLLLDNKIAVEARRLNQFKNLNGVNEPLEDLEHDIMPRVKNLIRSYDSQPSPKTSFVHVSYKRPLKVKKHVLKEVERVLHSHLNYLDQATFYDITPTLQLRFRPSTGNKKYNKPYVWASSYDDDSGGSVVHNMLESLKIIIREKEGKVLPYKSLYPIWWLAVTDNIGYGIDDIDLSQLTDAFNIETFFEKIIFISPNDSTYGKELIVK